MIKKYIFDEKQKKFVERVRKSSSIHFVQPDFEEHGGRTKFREYLKRKGCIEMGRSDIASAQEKWNQRQSDHAAKIKKPNQFVREVDPPSGEIRQIERSQIQAAVMNRLEGRPAPDRKTLIKIGLEEARRR